MDSTLASPTPRAFVSLFGLVRLTVPGLFFAIALLALPGLASANSSDAAGARLSSVDIQGISGNQANNVRLSLTIRRLIESDDTTEAQIRFHHAQAESQIAEALAPFGYYEVKVDAQLTEDANRYRAVYRITPGEPTRVTQLDIRLGEQQQLAERFPLSVGDVIVHGRYEAGKTDLTRRLRQLGYFDQRLVRQRLEIDKSKRSARVVLHFELGKRHVFGDVRIRGAHLDERLIKRFIQFQPGDDFHQDALNELQRDLSGTDYFSQVLVSTELSGRDGERVPIVIDLQPGARRAYNAALTVGTDSGVGIELGADFRWLNQRGHSVKSEISTSQLATRFGVNYRIPDLDRRGSGYTLGLSREREDSDTALRTTNRATVGRFGLLPDDWQWIARIALQRETFTIADVEDQVDLIVPELIVNQKQANNITRPRRGHSYQGELRGSSDALGSDASFLQIMLRGRWIFPVASDDRLLLSSSFGTTNVDSVEQLPASFRFYTGGDRTVRGFAYHALGPLDDEGNVIGGKHLLVASGEYERRFGENWGGAVFVDTGNALNRFSDKLEISTGLGFRYFSPLGPIRLDVARTLTETTLGEKDWRIHFTVGPDL